MMLTCTLKTPWGIQEMRELFATELDRQHSRSSVALEDNEGKGTFTITAQDVTALRATLNGVTTVLSMYQRTQQAVHEQTHS